MMIPNNLLIYQARILTVILENNMRRRNYERGTAWYSFMKNNKKEPFPTVVTQGGDWRPIPDPTVMTTLQLENAITSQRDVFETRLAAMDKAIILLQEMANRSPTIGEVFGIHGTKLESLEKRLDHKYVETSTDINHLRDLHSERMNGLEKRMDNQFIERDKRLEQLAMASSTAIAAALQAQKEAANETQKSSSLAITKSDVATADSIKQLQILFQTAISGLNTQVLDVKSRLDKGEGQGLGKITATDDYRYEQGARREQSVDNRGLVFGIVGSVIGFGALLITLILNIARGQLHLP